MAHNQNAPDVPYDSDGLADLHQEIAWAFRSGFIKAGNFFSAVLDDDCMTAALRGLLNWTCSDDTLEFLDQVGWREFLDQESSCSVDFVGMTRIWRTAAEYAGQGIAPDELAPLDVNECIPSVEDRSLRVNGLIYTVKSLRDGAPFFIGHQYDHILEGCLARAALDFGGTLTLGGLQVLARLSLAAIRTAISLGELHPNADGQISAEEAAAWLVRRRDFCPSRWKNPLDDQFPFNPSKVTGSEDGVIHVPQDSDGAPFVPKHVVRKQRSGGGISIYIGPKGQEQQIHDYYEALHALATMDVPRWRRRNSAGNWGIVRARGSWVSISKAEVDRQLAEKSGETA